MNQVSREPRTRQDIDTIPLWRNDTEWSDFDFKYSQRTAGEGSLSRQFGASSGFVHSEDVDPAAYEPDTFGEAQDFCEMFELTVVIGAVVVVCDITEEVVQGQANDVFGSNDESEIERAELDIKGGQFMVELSAD